MTELEATEFIERMEEFGDVWELDDVMRVYGDKTLEEALSDRRSHFSQYGNIIATLLNR